MNIRLSATLRWIAASALAISLFAGSAQAEDPFETRGASLGEAVQDEELSILRGGIDIVAVDSDTDVDARVEDNLIQGVTNGDISISDNAMSNISGIFVGAVNSGHMAVVQQSLTFVVVTDK